MTWSVSYVLLSVILCLAIHHQDPVVAMPGTMFCASVMEYELMLNDVKSTMLPSQCMSGQCRYNINLCTIGNWYEHFFVCNNYC